MTRKPNFLIVGAQKAGTTFLSGKLRNHKDVFVSNPKELLFFQKKGINENDFQEYLNQNFSNVKNERYVNESSAIYLQWPNAIENIKSFLGSNLKIIICLRQPTDRAVSFYLHNYKRERFSGREPILKATEDFRLSPVETSIYSPYIGKWLGTFGRENIHFQLFDDLLESPTNFVRSTTDFLGIPPLQSLSQQAVNKGFELTWKGDSLTLDVDSNNENIPSFSLNELKELHSGFLDDIEKTSKLIGRDLSHWKSMPEFTAKQKNW